MSNFMKIRSVRDKLFQTDGRTDMKKLRVTFRNFLSVTKQFSDNTGQTFCIVSPMSTCVYFEHQF